MVSVVWIVVFRKKPLLKKADKTIIGKLLRDHGVLKDGMI